MAYIPAVAVARLVILPGLLVAGVMLQCRYGDRAS